ncbi:hypothetical protein HUT18_23345 [Streptomyces sp. NA04227]|uniref:hypothetical protein n=1 Tax=Streptomyces sp. NA04227 TaxID=2742136 RepID=UPI0015926C2A|nr:hypothetical protein [Streptomyces sp. NA04227]QKW08875.1 hypothetical protein HUT18_23345 [Streptomyces sp. NA04227]
MPKPTKTTQVQRRTDSHVRQWGGAAEAAPRTAADGTTPRTHTRRTPWLRTAASLALLPLLAVALTACGGDDEGGDKAKDPASSGSPSDKPSGTPTGKPSAKPSGSPDDGQELGPGESGRGEVANRKTETTYVAGAQKVDIGTEADARKLVDDPALVEGKVPATAYLKLTNDDGGTIAGHPRIGDIRLTADGQPGTPLDSAEVRGKDVPPAKGCETPEEITNWKEGESHVFCETFLIPKGAVKVLVQWVKDPADGFTYSWDFTVRADGGPRTP